MEKFGLKIENSQDSSTILSNIETCFSKIESGLNLDADSDQLDQIKLFTSPGTDLDERLKSDLEKIYKYNHPQVQPYDIFYNEVTQPEFNNALKDKNSRFIIAKDNKGHVVCFFILTPIDDKTVSLGAVMGNLLYPSKIAIKTVKEIADYLNENNLTVRANVDCDSPASDKYINKAGFVGKNIMINVKDTNVNGFEIERKPTNNHSPEEIGSEKHISINVLNYNNPPNRVALLFEETNGDKNEFLQTCEEMFKRDYVLTKYLITLPHHSGNWCEAIDEIGVAYAKNRRRYCIFSKK